MILKSFTLFLFWPFKERLQNRTVKEKIIAILLLTIFNIGFLFCHRIITLFLTINHICPPLTAIKHLGSNFAYLFIVPLLLAPIVEEIIFRLWIVYGRLNLSISIVLITFYIGLIIFNQHLSDNWLRSNIEFTLLLAMLIGIIIYFFLKKYDKKIQTKWINCERLFVFISAIIFGYMHISKFVITKEFIYWSPFLLSSFIVHGLVFGFIRIRIGFLYAIASHLLLNLFILFLN